MKRRREEPSKHPSEPTTKRLRVNSVFSRILDAMSFFTTNHHPEQGILDLPVELQVGLLQYLPAKDVITVSGVCRAFYPVANDYILWKYLASRNAIPLSLEEDFSLKTLTKKDIVLSEKVYVEICQHYHPALIDLIGGPKAWADLPVLPTHQMVSTITSYFKIFPSDMKGHKIMRGMNTIKNDEGQDHQLPFLAFCVNTNEENSHLPKLDVHLLYIIADRIYLTHDFERKTYNMLLADPAQHLLEYMKMLIDNKPCYKLEGPDRQSSHSDGRKVVELTDQTELDAGSQLKKQSFI